MVNRIYNITVEEINNLDIVNSLEKYTSKGEWDEYLVI